MLLREDKTGLDIRHATGPHWVTIVLTWRCPAACSHCGVDSSPRNRTKLDVDLARKAVSAAARFRPKPRISFTGGEPFVEFQAMLQLVALAGQNGMSSEVVTSAAWVADRERCEIALKQLRDVGLRTLCVSFDRFHNEYIPTWKVATAIRSGLSVGLKVVLKTLIDEQEPDSPEDLMHQLRLTAEELRACVVRGQPLSAVGRAASFVERDLETESAPIQGGCAFAGENPTLAPTAKLYPCCGPVMGQVGAHAELFTIANLEGASVEQVGAALGHGRSDVFVALLKRIGPGGIISAVQAKHPEIRMRRKFVSQCDGCEEILQNAELRTQVYELLDRAQPPHA